MQSRKGKMGQDNRVMFHRKQLAARESESVYFAVKSFRFNEPRLKISIYCFTIIGDGSGIPPICRNNSSLCFLVAPGSFIRSPPMHNVYVLQNHADQTYCTTDIRLQAPWSFVSCIALYAGVIYKEDFPKNDPNVNVMVTDECYCFVWQGDN